jgi:hypothetical protein
MRMIGAAKLKQFGDSDEMPHSPSDHPSWQESVLIHWFDRNAGIGGLQRIGHEPHRNGGQAVLWSNVFTTDGVRYRRCHEGVPFVAGDQFPDGFGAGPTHRFWFDGNPRWSVREEDIAVELEVHNLFPVLDVIHGDMGTLSESFAANHFEAAGRILGHAEIAGRRIEIDGFCYRDHSWGVRDWSTALLTHRWITGTFGSQLSFGLTTWHGADGKLSKFGFIVREDEVIYTEDVDVVMFMEADGITHRGGEATFRLPDGKEYLIRFRAVDGAIFMRGAIACLDVMCEAECDGMIGYCDGEISTNPRLGNAPITLAMRADIGDGLRMPAGWRSA